METWRSGCHRRSICTRVYASKQPVQDFRDALARVSIPQRRHGALLSVCLRESLSSSAAERRSILPHQNVRSHGHGHRTFRIVPQREARHFQICGFFLNAARVGDDSRSAALQRQKFDVRQRFPQIQLAGIECRIRQFAGGSADAPGKQPSTGCSTPADTPECLSRFDRHPHWPDDAMLPECSDRAIHSASSPSPQAKAAPANRS